MSLKHRRHYEYLNQIQKDIEYLPLNMSHYYSLIKQQCSTSHPVKEILLFLHGVIFTFLSWTCLEYIQYPPLVCCNLLDVSFSAQGGTSVAGQDTEFPFPIEGEN